MLFFPTQLGHFKYHQHQMQMKNLIGWSLKDIVKPEDATSVPLNSALVKVRKLPKEMKRVVE